MIAKLRFISAKVFEAFTSTKPINNTKINNAIAAMMAAIPPPVMQYPLPLVYVSRIALWPTMCNENTLNLW
jgi:hypothetical protein